MKFSLPAKGTKNVAAETRKSGRFAKIGVLIASATLSAGLVACSSDASGASVRESTRTDVLASLHEPVYETNEVTKDNSQELRLASQEDAQKDYGSSEELSDQIKLRLFNWWGDWQPDYASWLKIADSLYAPDAGITAIGGETQKYSDYRLAMKSQRDQVDMAMGPIMNIAVDGNTATLVYHMYLTPKAAPDKTFDTIVTEYNTFGEVDGDLMVTDLHLYTDGGGMY